MVILMTSLSSSKTEFTCIFYDVFDVGGFAGSSRLEVSLLYLLAFLPCLLAVLMLLVVLFPTSLSLLNSELICRSYGSSGFLESGFCLVPAVVPHAPAVVPLGALSHSTTAVPLFYRLDFGSCSFRVGFSSSCTTVRHGSSAYRL